MAFILTSILYWIAYKSWTHDASTYRGKRLFQIWWLFFEILKIFPNQEVDLVQIADVGILVKK